MNGLSFNNQQVFILNGHPVIIQRNQDASSASDNLVSGPSNIALQQNTLDQSLVGSVTDQHASSQFEVTKDTLVQDNVGSNETQFVAYVGNSDDEQENDEQDVPIIHITLEQAAELGLHLENDEIKLSTDSIPLVSPINERLGEGKQLLPFNVFESKTDTLSNNDLEMTVFSNRKTINESNNTEINRAIDKENILMGSGGFKMVVDNNLSFEDTDQQLTVIPHFSNGAITYSIQVDTNSIVPDKTLIKSGNKKLVDLEINDCNTSPIESNSYSKVKSFQACATACGLQSFNLEDACLRQAMHSTEVIQLHNNTGNNNNEITLNLESPSITTVNTPVKNHVNFTSLSDLLKSTDTFNKKGSADQNSSSLSNCQPISLTQLINSISKDQNNSNEKMNVSVAPTDAVLKSTNNLSNNVNNCGNVTNMKGSNDKFILLKSKSCINNNPVILNNNQLTRITNNPTTDSMLVPSSIITDTKASSQSSLVPVCSDKTNELNRKLTTMANTSQPAAVSTTSCLINAVNFSAHLESNFVSTVNSNETSSMINGNNTCQLPSVYPTNGYKTTSGSNGSTVKLVNSFPRLIQPVSVTQSLSSQITERLLTETHDEAATTSGRPKIGYQLKSPRTVALSETPEVATSVAETVVVSTTPSSETVAGESSGNDAAATVSKASPLALDGTNCVLSQEVTAALNRLPLANNSSKPLGSSENPIQLVQQGLTFHSAQALTADQLKQVTTVLQQNHFSNNNPSKNVIYDAETNTKIIYRIVYPEEFDLKEPSATGDDKCRKRGRPSLKSTRRTPNNDVQDENTVVKRKQPLPRTRSGRLSRPPRYMVRDYKRIKRSELDDSDGAYSDYQSDAEEDVADKNLLPGLALPQKRNISSTFRCPTCNKVYLGYRRMAHHFAKYADHSTEEYLLQLKKACQPKRDQYTTSSAPATPTAFNEPYFKEETGDGHGLYTNVITGMDTGVATATTVNLLPSQVATPQDSSMPAASPNPNTPANDNLTDTVVGSSVDANTPRNVVSFSPTTSRRKCKAAKKRGRKSAKELQDELTARLPTAQYQPQMSSTYTKAKLREIMDKCDVSELTQVAGPAVCSVLTAWELLLLRVDSIRSQQNRVELLCEEIKLLLSRFKELAGTLFQPVDNIIKSGCTNNAITFEVDDKILSSAFGIPCGVYQIDESFICAEKMISKCKEKSLLTNESWKDMERVASSEVVVAAKKATSSVVSMVINEELKGNATACVMRANEDDFEDGDLSECELAARRDRLESSAVMGGRSVGLDDEAARGGAANMASSQYLLTNDGSLLCEERGGLDDSVEQIVNEQLKKLTSSQNQDLCKAEVDELIKGFGSVLGHENHHHGHLVQMRGDQSEVLDPSDDLMAGFSTITGQRNHVSASTEDLIKSLENFSSELHNSTCGSRQDFIGDNDNFTERVTVNNVNVVDALDFDVLSQDFHHSNNVNQS